MEYDKVAQVWSTYKIRNATYRLGQNSLAWFGLFVYQVRKEPGVSGKWLTRCVEKNGVNEQSGPITLLDEHEGRTRLKEYLKKHMEEGFVGALTPGYSEYREEAENMAIEFGFLPKREVVKVVKAKAVKPKAKTVKVKPKAVKAKPKAVKVKVSKPKKK